MSSALWKRSERRSLIEVLRHGQERFLNLPMAAAAFARRQLNAASMDLELLDLIEDDSHFLMQFGPMTPEDVERGGLAPRVRRFAGAVAVNASETGELSADEHAALQYLAKAHVASAPAIAPVFEQAGDYDAAIVCMRSYVDQHKEEWGLWKDLARLYYAKRDVRSAVQSLVQGSIFAGADLNNVSYAADRLSAALREQPQMLDQNTRKTYAARLLGVMEPRLDEASGGDLARVAWL
jgi:hypothetical protein